MRVGVEYEGFISSRARGTEIARILAKRLEKVGVYCANHDVAGHTGASAHNELTTNLIRTVNFCVVLIEPDFYRSKTDKKHFQFLELQAAFDGDSSNAQDKFSAGCYQIIPVLLSETREPRDLEFEAEIDEIERYGRIGDLTFSQVERGIYGRLGRITDRLQVFEYLDPDSVHRAASINALVVKIEERARHVADARIKRAQQYTLSKIRLDAKAYEARQKEDEAKRRQEREPVNMFASVGAANVAEAEQAEADIAKAPALPPRDPVQAFVEDYIEKAAAAWQTGRVSGAEQKLLARKTRGRRKAKSTKSEGPFNFVSARFMELEGELERGGSKRAEDISRGPLSKWLFQTVSGIIYLQGEAGAGKTTTSVATALAYAWKWRPEDYESKLDDFSNGKWMKEAESHLGPGATFHPICVSVPHLAEYLADSDTVTASELVSAIHECMRSELPDKVAETHSGVTVEDFEAFLHSQNVVLILDAFDEVSGEIAEAVNNAAKDLFARMRKGRPDSFRLIITSRPDVLDIDHRDLQIRLLELDWAKIEAFIAEYAGQSKGKLQRILKQASVRFNSGTQASRRIVQRPLFLNVFCWHLQKRGEATNLLDFCEKVVDHLTSGRPFERLRDFVAEGEGDEASARAARRILVALADLSLRDGTRGEVSLGRAGKVLVSRHADFGLNALDEDDAEEIIQELAIETNLMSVIESSTTSDPKVSFSEQLLFGEYLVSEAIAGSGEAGLVGAVRASDIRRWENAFSFADSRRVKSGLEGLPFAQALLERAEASLPGKVTPKSDIANALEFLRTGISVLNEAAVTLTTDIPPEALLAIRLYRRSSPALDVLTRNRLLNSLMRLGVRENADEQRKAVKILFDTLLEPRDYWVPCKAPGLPDGYRMADGPVHVAGFTAFCQAEDRGDPELWDHVPVVPDVLRPATAITDLLGNPDTEAATQPVWTAQARKLGAPVVGVTWYEAVAYCRWLTRKLRRDGDMDDDEIIRLPTESEWVAIALLCADGRTYPFGDEITPENANTGALESEMSIEGPSVAGVFPPVGPGLYDFGSNVRCWVTAEGAGGDVPWPYTPRVNKLNGGRLKPQLLKVGGGSWFCLQETSYRADAQPESFDGARRRRLHGFRVVRVRTSSEISKPGVDI
ncbi:MAG: SUMF1/EgtB/PvdO family nonheme iron enzyme [Hyphomonas sp.]